MLLAERNQYDKDVSALYQKKNAWQDNETQMKYAKEFLLPYMEQRREDCKNKTHVGKLQGGAVWDDGAEEEAPYGTMEQDNLKSQCQEQFVTFVEDEASMLCEKEESTHSFMCILYKTSDSPECRFLR